MHWQPCHLAPPAAAVLSFPKNPSGTRCAVAVFTIHYQNQSLSCNPQAVQGDLPQWQQASVSSAKTYLVFALTRPLAIYLFICLFISSA